MNEEYLIYSREEIELQRVADAAEREAAWSSIGDSLANSVGREAADETVAAFRELFSLFGPGAVDWLANLYDPVTGGYFYSNSAKETPLYRPDLESTYQALNFMTGSGMATNGDIPAWQSESIVRFTKSLQDPNGYFYHPQWGKRVTDLRHHSRRGRDLTWAHRLLERFGARPTYDTPLGVKGDGLLADGTPATAAGCSSVGSEAASTAEIPAHLKDKESFLAYLDGLDLSTNGYYIGNLFESQSNQIVARDAQLRAEGADYSLSEVLLEWFEKGQNPVTGLWTPGERVTYDGINGLLKISSTVYRMGLPLPRLKEAFRSAMSVISSDADPVTVCFVLNPWYALVTMLHNVEECFSPEDKEKNLAATDEIRREMLLRAPELIRATAKKLKKFLKEDGSFSYMQAHSGPNSQGLPVAIAWTNEGDMNASYICTVATTSHVFTVLGCKMPRIFMAADKMRYFNLLEKNRRDTEYWNIRINQLK